MALFTALALNGGETRTLGSMDVFEGPFLGRLKHSNLAHFEIELGSSERTIMTRSGVDSRSLIFRQEIDEKGRLREYPAMAGSLILTLEEGSANRGQLTQVITDLGGSVTKQIDHRRWLVDFRVFDLTDLRLIKETLRTVANGVAGIQHEVVFFAHQAASGYFVPQQSFPTDASFDQQWSLHNDGSIVGSIDDVDVDAPEVWDYIPDASGVKVGIIDSGIQLSHPELPI